MEQAHSPQAEDRVWCWRICQAPLNWRTCHWKHLLGRSALALPHSAPSHLGRSQATGFRSLYMQGWVLLHGNAYFTYHFISNNGKLNTGCEAMSGFRLEGGGGGKAVSPSGNLSDGMPNAVHLRQGVDRGLRALCHA